MLDHPALRPGRGMDRDRLQGLIFLTLTALGWGLNWPVAKTLLSRLPPFSMRSACVVAGIFFSFSLAAARGEHLRVPAGQWGNLAISSALNFGAFSILTTLALVWLPASEAVIITYTMPIWTALMAWPMLGERPTAQRLLALMLGLSGVLLILGGGVEATAEKIPGVLCALAGAWLFALGSLHSKRHPIAMGPVAGVAWQVALSLPPMLFLAAFETPHWAGVRLSGWLSVAYISIVPMTLAYLAWFRALKLLPVSIAATGVLLSPIAGVLASAAMLGEPLGPRQIVALALTLGGVALAARS